MSVGEAASLSRDRNLLRVWANHRARRIALGVFDLCVHGELKWESGNFRFLGPALKGRQIKDFEITSKDYVVLVSLRDNSYGARVPFLHPSGQSTVQKAAKLPHLGREGEIHPQ